MLSLDVARFHVFCGDRRERRVYLIQNLQCSFRQHTSTRIVPFLCISLSGSFFLALFASRVLGILVAMLMVLSCFSYMIRSFGLIPTQYMLGNSPRSQ
ncbi:hypothetical protein HBH64_220130 [Parastagonospora nodorum]|nr:hypothetical protein HBH46_184300 [Parastagonospora nodorum]KAH4118402.1 hypothetical protein HBH47_141390 [Parastagonospora nodorum]KAH4301891.1 hypothetical protein HBI01_100200 [Parastagonospora nodorum]KAH4306534.1 hypothetical protein HBI02_120570 [Parastagonospora nodorum]KAH4330600.1 hypothetical protein HBI00_078350 [Parastagonospora nodorum]